jgi:hypothetical protein
MVMSIVAEASAQQPFSTDDAAVTPKGSTHVELFNEYDWLQENQLPHRRQNTFNMRVNVGVGHGLELDVDSPLLAVANMPATVPSSAVGFGDTNFGVKYNFHEEYSGSNVPAFTTAIYVETPTGDPETGLGSGVVDVWTYLVVQKSLNSRFMLRVNGGYLFAGNTSTGVVGIETTRGHIATAGASLVARLSSRLGDRRRSDRCGVQQSGPQSGAAAVSSRRQLRPATRTLPQCRRDRWAVSESAVRTVDRVRSGSPARRSIVGTSYVHAFVTPLA